MKHVCNSVAWGTLVLLPVMAAAGPPLSNGTNVSNVRWHTYGKLTLPVDADRNGVADDIQAPDLETYNSSYFYNTSAGQKTAEGYVAAGGETVFWAPVDGGGTTNSTDTVRSEMREQLKFGDDRVNWTTTGIHIQSGTVKVTKLPKPKKSGSPVKTIVAQLHAFNSNSPPLKLQFSSSSADGVVVYAIYNETPNRGGYAMSRKIKMALKESFTYELKMADGILTTKINDELLSTRDMRPNWSKSKFYFKAGNYLQNSTKDATGSAEVVYTNLTVSHN